MNKVTHSYTAMYSITASGKLLPKVFLCLQEKGGSFGPRIQEHIRDIQEEYKNISVTCSSSGKLSTCHMDIFTDKIVKPYVTDEDFLLVLDSWGGHAGQQHFRQIYW